jgi:hypothetical protein
MDLLRDVLVRNMLPHTPKDLSRALNRLFDDASPVPRDALLSAALDALDEYMTKDTDDSVFDEPSLQEAYNGDLNAFLKAEQFGKTDDATPRFRSLLAATKKTLGRKSGGSEQSPRDTIAAAARGS